MKYVAQQEAGPMPVPLLAERRQQAMVGLKHAMALDPERGAPFISIHRKWTPEGGGPASYPGNAHETLDSALSSVFYLADKTQSDVYWSMGAQAIAGEKHPKVPFPKAVRQGPNIVQNRCLYIDSDVKPADHPDVTGTPGSPGKPAKPPSAYASSREAAAALLDFIDALAVEPTMIVGSGRGGFHIYWRLVEPVTPAQFGIMAGGLVASAVKSKLRFDRQCTGDITRLLRPPGTWNFKRGTGDKALPVVIIYLGAE